MNNTMYQQRSLGVNVPNLSQTDSPQRLAAMVEHDALNTAQKLANSAETLYRQDFEISSRRMISEIYAKNPNDPDALRREFDAAQKGLLKDATPEQSLELQMQFEMLAMPSLSKAAQNRIDLNTNKIKENSITILNQVQNDSEHRAANMLSDNPQVAMDASRALQTNMMSLEEEINRLSPQGNPIYSPEQKVHLRENFRKQVMLTGLKNYFDTSSNKPEAMQQILNGNKTLKLYDAQGNLDLELNPLEDMSVYDFDKFKKHMETEIKRGQVAAEDNEDYNRVKDSLSGSGYLIDPTSKRDAAGLDEVFTKDFLPTISNMPPIEQGKSTVDFVERAGSIPNTLKSRMATTVRNGSTEQQVYAATVLDGIARTRPQAIEDFSKADVSYAIALNNMVAEGIEPETAIERLKDTFDPRNAELIKKRKDDVQAIKKDMDPITTIKKIFKDESTDWFGSPSLSMVANTSDRLVARFNSIYEDEYLLSGDQNIALERTGQRLKSQYGVTTIGAGSGSRIMRYPPIKFYQLEGVDNKKWMERDFRELSETLLPGVPKTDIYLIDDEQTASEARDERPTYPVIYKNKNGALLPLMNEQGQQVRFAPNIERAINEYNKEVESQKREMISAKKFAKDFREDPENIVQTKIAEGLSSAAESVGTLKKKVSDIKHKHSRKLDKFGIEVGAFSND